jgi:hypothetical protein
LSGIVNGTEGRPTGRPTALAEGAKIKDANGLSGLPGASGQSVGQQAGAGGWILRRRSGLNLLARIRD